MWLVGSLNVLLFVTLLKQYLDLSKCIVFIKCYIENKLDEWHQGWVVRDGFSKEMAFELKSEC